MTLSIPYRNGYTVRAHNLDCNFNPYKKDDETFAWAHQEWLAGWQDRENEIKRMSDNRQCKMAQHTPFGP